MNDVTIERTRRSLHVVAESIMAGPQYRTSGTIRLRVLPNGFATRREPRLAVEVGQLVHAGGRVQLTGATLAEIATQVGIEAGPAGIYHDGANGALAELIDVDPVVAQWMFDALSMGQQALKAFAPDEDPVLWPEHFDVGILVDNVSYGVSPGDRHIGVPYAYVSATAPDDDSYWNESFGAARMVGDLGSSRSDKGVLREGQLRLSNVPMSV